MKQVSNIPYYAITIGLFILLKWGYTLADNDSLSILLKPTSQIIALLTGSQLVYFPDKGYYFHSLNIVIEKSCSGYNFWLICFCMLSILMLQYAKSITAKLLVIPISLSIAFVIAIIVNSSRIFASIIVQQQAVKLLSNKHHVILHEIVGAVTNLFFLILVYYLFERLLNNKIKNAKFTES